MCAQKDGNQQPLNDTAPNSSPQYTKDEDFWYWDGNVVLAHGNTMFRLHASRLSTHSRYFHELFAPGMRPAAMAPSSVAEGCGLYQVSKELPIKAFKYFLKALETPWYACVPSRNIHDSNTMDDSPVSLIGNIRPTLPRRTSRTPSFS